MAEQFSPSIFKETWREGGREGGANRRRAPRRRLCPPLLAEGGFSSPNLNTHIYAQKSPQKPAKGRGKILIHELARRRQLARRKRRGKEEGREEGRAN